MGGMKHKVLTVLYYREKEVTISQFEFHECLHEDELVFVDSGGEVSESSSGK